MDTWESWLRKTPIPASTFLTLRKPFPTGDYFHELAWEGPRKVARYSLAANLDAHITPYRTLESHLLGKVWLLSCQQ